MGGREECGRHAGRGRCVGRSYYQREVFRMIKGQQERQRGMVPPSGSKRWEAERGEEGAWAEGGARVHSIFSKRGGGGSEAWRHLVAARGVQDGKRQQEGR